MKKLIAAAIFVSAALPAQIAIGKPAISSPSVSLEFGTGNKGIILPWVSNSSGVSLTSDGALKKGGVFILNTANRKVELSTNDGSWKDLTLHINEAPATAGNVAIDTALQTNSAYLERTNAKTLIGGNAATDPTPGILVLADTNKAMILPLVQDPHLNIKNPAPGMMVYDQVKKLFAVYNGTVWTFWKP